MKEYCRYKRALWISAALLLCAFAAACTTDSEALKAVEGWYFTRYYGSLTGGTEGQFDQYDSQFLSDSQWNGIKPYSKQEDGDTNVTWYGVVSWMTNQGFSQEVIDKLKERLASNERAVYVYARSAAGYNVYYWVRFVKN